MRKLKKIDIKNEEIIYTLCKSRRAKNICLTVNSRAEVTLSLPWLIPERFGTSFLTKKAEWLLKKIEFYRSRENPIPCSDAGDYVKYKTLALDIAQKKIARFNAFYGYTINKISIRNQRTRWGSCSRNGNLNFSYRIIYLPEESSDYIIVHELCHLGEFNHSKRFWNLVAKIVPDYKKVRKKIRGM
jgi:hypothetical protein